MPLPHPHKFLVILALIRVPLDRRSAFLLTWGILALALALSHRICVVQVPTKIKQGNHLARMLKQGHMWINRASLLLRSVRQGRINQMQVRQDVWMLLKEISSQLRVKKVKRCASREHTRTKPHKLPATMQVPGITSGPMVQQSRRYAQLVLTNPHQGQLAVLILNRGISLT